MLLYGKNSVCERLKARPKTIKKIFVEEDFSDARIFALAGKVKVPLAKVSARRLNKIKRAPNCQGIVAEVEAFAYTPFEDLVYNKAPDKLSLIFLDRLYDPQNLGAIIRTAAAFGNFAVVIPKHKACPVTETVLHIACGGENFVPVAMVSNLSGALIKAKKNGYWLVGAQTRGGKNIREVSLPFPLGLVLGSEGEGIRYGVDKHLDLRLSIPMRGAPISFNVTMACAVFCYEISKQSKTNG